MDKQWIYCKQIGVQSEFQFGVWVERMFVCVVTISAWP